MADAPINYQREQITTGAETPSTMESLPEWLSRLGFSENMIRLVEAERIKAGAGQESLFEHQFETSLVWLGRDVNCESQRAVRVTEAGITLPPNTEKLTYERGFVVFVAADGSLGYVKLGRSGEKMATLTYNLPGSKRVEGVISEDLELGKSFYSSLPTNNEGTLYPRLLPPIVAMAISVEATIIESGETVILPYSLFEAQQQLGIVGQEINVENNSEKLDSLADKAKSLQQRIDILSNQEK